MVLYKYHIAGKRSETTRRYSIIQKDCTSHLESLSLLITNITYQTVEMNNSQITIRQDSIKRLDSLNQAIWDFGFTTQTLSELQKITKDIHHGSAIFERIPQAQQSGLSKGSEILTSAGIICRGCPGTESEIRAIYDTDDLIGEGLVQEIIVEKWAKIRGCWFEKPELYLSSISELRDYGTESEVFFDVSHFLVRKIISLKHYNILRLALDRIIIHNAIFPETFLKVLGFGRNTQGAFVIIAEQPYCSGTVLPEEERQLFMHGLGFEDAGEDYGMHLNYRTNDIYIGDLNDYNVIKGETGIFVIDADCRLNTPHLGCGGSYKIPQPSVDYSRPCAIL